MELRTQVVVGLVLLLVIPTSALAGPGQAAVPDQLPNKTPEKCVSNPDRPVASNPDVTGDVTRLNESQLRVTYEVSNQSASLDDFAIRLERAATLSNKTGFDETSFGPELYWNTSVENHSIVYQMQSTDVGPHQVAYPSDDDWIIAATPQHYGVKVDLTANPEGYVGSSTLYLGEYSTERATTGCQDFVAIVPENVRFAGVPNHLQALKTAARSLPVGNQYQTVRVFVSPKGLGDASGFVPGYSNEIIIRDRIPGIPDSAVWIHEYVHTLQEFRAQPDMTWFYEASAEYLSLRVAVENGYISPVEYDHRLAVGAQEFSSDMVSSPQNQVAYRRGAIMLSQLDLELTDSYDDGVVDLLAEMNSVHNPGQSDVVDWLRDDVGMDGDDARLTVDRINSNEQLRPPLLSRFSDIEWLRKILYYLHQPALRFPLLIVGSAFVVDAAYKSVFKDQ